MKTFLTILLFASTLATKAVDIYRSEPVTYTIKSDKYTNDLLSGQVLVKGHVFDATGNGLAGVMVSTIDERMSALTDLSGAYEMIIHDSDTSIFIFKDGYKEVAIARYDFMPGHTVEIDFMPQLIPEIIVPDPELEPELIYTYKPVIYLYSDVAINVSLDLDYLGDLTFTYPVYNEGWNVNVDSNGISDPLTERAYPYLFWEGDMDDLEYEKKDGSLEGQMIACDTLVEFLENQLTAIGLNRQEQTDFITFWVPKMANSEYVFVQFLLDDLYANKVAELTVNPKPESLKRVYLLFTEFDEIPDLWFTPQVFESFQRNGFTLIEWGGSEISTITTL
ncbi:MAG: hypothetical protein GQ574_25110 [Crocinitomix sp.]|nr:hypothetical protein [Crocinitomix sp.]